ncbi:MBL fold metallo-hydrolase [Thermoanaerobacterium thermosulfurigenes]|uniref:MBL fold metallo-hydrolase n=1 Tax=Thermoanaerobacterium thermosulfurigenes TaxID=33950 RepID=UPI003EF83C2D
MKIGDNVVMLEISDDIMGSQRTIYPVLIFDNENAILVDTDFPGQLPKIREAIKETGVPFESINAIILTHHDIDHIGNLSDMVKELQGIAKVMAHVDEKPYIEGDLKPLKLAQLESKLNALPDEMKGIFNKMKSSFDKNRTKVDVALNDGEELPFCGGIDVIHTPGHTLGHVCLYLKKTKVLITGDMLNIKDGKLVPSSKDINFDDDMNLKSIEKIGGYDVKYVICYHSGLFKKEC